MMRKDIYSLLFLLLLSSHVITSYAYESNQFILRGTVKSDLIDTLSLHVWNDIVTYNMLYDEPHRSFTIPVKDRCFEFVVDSVADMSIINLSNGKLNGFPITLLDQYYICKGDDVEVTVESYGFNSQLTKDDNSKSIEKYRFLFKGKGAEKFKCRNQLDSVHHIMGNEYLRMSFNKSSKWVSDSLYYQRIVAMTNAEIGYFNSWKESLEQKVYETMYADIIGKNAYYLLKKLLLAARTYREDAIQLKKVQELLTSNELLKKLNFYHELDFTASSVFTQALVYKARVEERLFPEASVVNYITGFVKNAKLVDRVFTNYFIHHYTAMPNDQAKMQLDEAKDYIVNSVHKDLITKLKQSDEGESIPSFILYDMFGKEVDTRSFLGKILFIDFFYTGCSNCAGYFKKTVSKAEEYFKDNQDVVFVAISIDGNKDKWINSVKSGKYTSLNAVNLYTGGLGAQHPIIVYFNVFGYPKPLLIDKSGKIITTDFYQLGRTDPGALISCIEYALKYSD